MPFALSGAIIMLSTANAQNYLIFGGEVAASSGINVKTLRAKVILGASLAVGGVTAIVGMVGFIGRLASSCEAFRWKRTTPHSYLVTYFCISNCLGS